MPVSLTQAALNAASDIDRNVIDEARKSSWLFDNLIFDDVVNPAGGGATLTYGYTRLATDAGAAFRAINSEYSPQEATKVQVTVDLKPFGGSFQIDRVLDAIAAGRETAFQLAQKIKAARALFNDALINGDAGVGNAFDGLDVALAGSSTEDTAGRDWSGAMDEALAFTIMSDLDELLGMLDGPADAILANSKAIAKIKAAARRAGYFTADRNEFGQAVERYGNAVLIDPGAKAGASTDVIGLTSDGGTPAKNITDVYAVRLGLDGLHAISLAGQAPIRTWLPDFTSAGAVKTGEVEMVAAMALKATKAAAVLRDVAVSLV